MNDGQMQLPGAADDPIRRVFNRYAPGPERVARTILRAVRWRRTLIIPNPTALPLWWFKRLWHGLFMWCAALVTARLARMAEKRGLRAGRVGRLDQRPGGG
jgi:hypothetical protein